MASDAPAPVDERRTPFAAYRIVPRRVFLVLTAINLGLLVAYLISVAAEHAGLVVGDTRNGLARLVDMNSEVSIPKWWQQLLMVADAAFLFLIARLIRRRGGREWRWWLGLAIVFVALAIDEAASIHEISIAPLQRLLDVSSGPLAATWIYPVGLVVLIAIAVYLRFYLRLPRTTQLLFAIAFATFVTGAAGFEFLEWANSDPWIGALPPLSYSLQVAAEEFLELTGVAIFGFALLVHLRDHVPEHSGARIEFVGPNRPGNPA